jgi:hypothetical protein
MSGNIIFFSIYVTFGIIYKTIHNNIVGTCRKSFLDQITVEELQRK